MIKVYGAPQICVTCRNFRAIAKARKLIVEDINIIENTANLKAFLKIRESAPCFDEIRANNKIGIPCFEKEDGTITCDMNVALKWMGQPPVKEEEIIEKEENECLDCGNLLFHKQNQK